MISQERDCEHPIPGKGTGKVQRNILKSGCKLLLVRKSGWIGALIQDVRSGAILLGYNGRERN